MACAIVLSFMVFSGAAAAQTYVQGTAHALSGSASSSSASFPANTTAGNLILVAFDFNSGLAVSSITDSQRNIFTEVGNQLTTPGAASSRVYYASNIKGGADTVTVTVFGNSTYLDVYLAEYSGVDQVSPIDAQAGASGTAGTVSSGNGTTTVAGDLIYGFCPSDNTCTAGSGFNARSTFDGNLVEDSIAGNPSTYAATASSNSGWTMQMVALKPASSGSGSSSSSSSSSSSTPLNACDLNADGVVVNQADVQAAINMSLGLAPCSANIAGANVCNVEVVQRVINASLGNGCLTSTGVHVVVLSWTPSTSPGITGYEIARSTGSTGTFTSIGTVGATATSYTDTTVVSGTTYYYEIAAVAGSTVGFYSYPAVSAAVPAP